MVEHGTKLFLFFFFLFFFNDTATTEIYTLSLHDALPIYYTTNLTLADFNRPENFLAHRLYGEPLPADHGGPKIGRAHV